jgi:hypothetical protein
VLSAWTAIPIQAFDTAWSGSKGDRVDERREEDPRLVEVVGGEQDAVDEPVDASARAVHARRPSRTVPCHPVAVEFVREDRGGGGREGDVGGTVAP